MAVKDARDLQLWGTVAVVGAALAVVAAYLADGAPLVWAVATVEVLLVMVYVGRRFRYMARRAGATRAAGRARAAAVQPGARAGAAHCERCRRVHEQRAESAARRATLSVTGAVEEPGSAGHVVGHQRDTHVLDDEGPEGEGVEDLVEPEPSW
ncbi:hypothetical protein [Kitasatospora nipponensis]|uniref:hypothetical protein n=1 Tax=Kitasatospora nipponensis TaxID=258049 RepID=UPI0031D308F5